MVVMCVCVCVCVYGLGGVASRVAVCARMGGSVCVHMGGDVYVVVSVYICLCVCVVCCGIVSVRLCGSSGATSRERKRHWTTTQSPNTTQSNPNPVTP